MGKRVTSTKERLEPLTYTIPEVAEALRISRRTMESLVHSEGFPAFRVGKCIRIGREDLREWVRRQTETGMGDHYVRKCCVQNLNINIE